MGNTNRRNTIVVGAGASKEFGLPTGAELAREIAQISDIRFDDFGSRLASGDYEIVETLRLLVRQEDGNRGDINPHLRAAWQIRDNMPLAPSIDNFLDTHRQNKELVEFGKLAICNAIQKAESRSSLAVSVNQSKQNLAYDQLENTWLLKLFKILVSQRTFEVFLSALSEITFISFNYDRCIHQFFYYASGSYFALEQADQMRVLESLNVIFPYGNVGDFAADGRLLHAFGVVQYGDQLISQAKALKTFTEGADEETGQRIRDAMFRSEVVIFLGFGFLGLNMQMLFQNEVFPPHKIIGTGKGLSSDSISEVEMELERVFKWEPTDDMEFDDSQRVKILDCTCGDLFHQYERFLNG